MFHVKQLLYVRLDFEVPESGKVSHVAELEPIDHEHCTMVRIIELDHEGVIRGAAHQRGSRGMMNLPQQVVPHPDTYDQFPDISSQAVSPEEFQVLWLEACSTLGEF
ncbi:hypothetical protein GSS88_05540 [Corynebacterium sp. 3HC-13]|nr:hypothetical protein [Corynebacterium poyangense]